MQFFAEFAFSRLLNLRSDCPKFLLVFVGPKVMLINLHMNIFNIQMFFSPFRYSINTKVINILQIICNELHLKLLKCEQLSTYCVLYYIIKSFVKSAIGQIKHLTLK